MVASALKRLTVLALILFCATSAFGASTARQVDFIVAGLEKDGDPCSGCKVYTYETGTTTAKETYLDRLKAAPQTNPIILDSEGRAEVFADGLYKMVITEADDTSYFDIDGLDYGTTGAVFTTLSQYLGLSEAIDDIGATETVLVIDTTDTLDGNVTVPANVTFMVTTPDAIDLNGNTLTMNGSIWSPTIEWIVGSSGTFTGSPIVQVYDSTWIASTVTDTTSISYSLASNSFSKGSDIASASALDIGKSGSYFDVTGTTNISSISSRGVGAVVKLHFDDSLTIINSTNLELTGANNIAVASGDEFEFVEYESGKWRSTIASGTSSTLSVEIKNIGPWDMSTDNSILVSTSGITHMNIRAITAMIRRDAGGLETISLGSGVGDSTQQAYIDIDTASPNVNILRLTGGVFDAAAFSKEYETIDNAAAVDKGGGLVGIPITGHVFNVNDETTISGSTNYNDTYTIISVTANEIVITATYIAETFAGTEQATWDRGWLTMFLTN